VRKESGGANRIIRSARISTIFNQPAWHNRGYGKGRGGVLVLGEQGKALSKHGRESLSSSKTEDRWPGGGNYKSSYVRGQNNHAPRGSYCLWRCRRHSDRGETNAESRGGDKNCDQNEEKKCLAQASKPKTAKIDKTKKERKSKLWLIELSKRKMNKDGGLLQTWKKNKRDDSRRGLSKPGRPDRESNNDVAIRDLRERKGG